MLLTIIKNNQDFQTVFEKGHSIYGRYMVVYFHHNHLNCSRFGFCVGKKLGNAVKRNYIKRLFREATRSFLPQLSNEWDIVVVAKRTIFDADLTRIIDELVHILNKASIINSNSKY